MTAIKMSAEVLAAGLIALTIQTFVGAEPLNVKDAVDVPLPRPRMSIIDETPVLNKAIRSEPKPELTKVKEDLPNFHEVHPFLYRGGEPTEAGLEKLKEMGIGTIIDLRAPSERKLDEKTAANKLGFHYINLVMDSHAPTDLQVEVTMSEIEKARLAAEKGEKNKKLFVHCAHGSDRTGCMIGIWRVAHEDWDYATTYKEMRKYYFTPKFIRLSGAVEEYAGRAMKKTPEPRAQ